MLGLVGKAYAACELGGDKVDLAQCLFLGNGSQVAAVYTSPAFLVNLLVRNAFVIAGVILFLLIFLGGFKFIQAGSKGKEEAKKILTSAVVGFIVMFSAYWIVQIIQLLTDVNIGI